MLTEFGGIGWDAEELTAPDASVTGGSGTEVPADRLAQPASWGSSTVGSGEEFAQRYRDLLAAVHRVERLAGFCYTQLADTYQEVNGLLRSDRSPKIPLEVIAEATLGPSRSFVDPLAH